MTRPKRKYNKCQTTITIPMIVRMRELRSVGLSVAAVARVISLDWGKPVTPDQVRRFCPAIRDGWYGGASLGVVGLARDNSANLPKPEKTAA